MLQGASSATTTDQVARPTQQTAHEPRLKGPFPLLLYRNILVSLRMILDRLHSMCCVASRQEWHTSVRRDFIAPVEPRTTRNGRQYRLVLLRPRLGIPSRSTIAAVPAAGGECQGCIGRCDPEMDVVRNRETQGSRQLISFAYAFTMRAGSRLDFLGRTR